MWYEEGLKFSCQQSGKCCRGEPGYIWVTNEDCQNIAKSLDIEFSDFMENCVYEIDGKKSLKEYENGDCIFYEEGCSVYEDRPVQCRTWPFWESNLKDKRAWEIAAHDCPGMNQGEHFSTGFINEQKDKMPEL